MAPKLISFPFTLCTPIVRMCVVKHLWALCIFDVQVHNGLDWERSMTKNVMLLYTCKPFTPPPHTHNALKIHCIENSASPMVYKFPIFFFNYKSILLTRTHSPGCRHGWCWMLCCVEVTAGGLYAPGHRWWLTRPLSVDWWSAAPLSH